MFADPVLIVPDSASQDDTFVAMPLINIDSGKSTRRFATSTVGEFLEFTISHSESKENPGIVTDRHLVRLDRVIPDASSKPVKASAYLVISEPRGTVSPGQVSDLVLGLISFLADFDGIAQTWSGAGELSTLVQPAIEATLARLRARES